jgi:predicted dehydrogenase
MKSTVSVGIAGYGYWGPNLARNFDNLPGSRVAAVCDASSERLEQAARSLPDAALFGGLREMLQHDSLEAVVVATPARTHHALAKAALLSGRHVLVEKPMATSVDECDELIQIAAERGLVLMVGHTFLYSEAVREILRIIDSGDLGEIRYINCQRLNLGLFQEDINVAWDLAPHDLSIILRVMGALPHIVNCQGHGHINPEVEDVANLSLRFGRDRFATIQNSWLEPRKVRQMTFVGSNKMIVYDDLEPREKIRIYDVRVERPRHYENFAEFHYAYHYGECRIPHLGHREPLRSLCAHFISCVRTGARPESCGIRGQEVVRVLEACDASLRGHGKPVRLQQNA